MDISATAHALSHAFFTRSTAAAAAWRGVAARCAQGVAGQHRRSIPFLPAFALVLGLAACGGGGGGGGGGIFIPSYNSGTAPARFIVTDGPPPPPGPNDVFVASTPTLPQDIDSGSTAASYVAPNRITPTAVTGGASDIRMANVSGGTMNGSRLFAISRDIVTGLSTNTGTDTGGGTAPRLGGTGSGTGTGSGAPRIGFQGAVTSTAFNTMINDVFKFSRDAMLTTSIGTEVETRVAKVEYAEGSSFRVLQHNYVGRRSSMYLLFPESGSQAVIVAGTPTAMTTIAALSGKYTYTGVVRAGDVAGEGANSASSVNSIATVFALQANFNPAGTADTFTFTSPGFSGQTLLTASGTITTATGAFATSSSTPAKLRPRGAADNALIDASFRGQFQNTNTASPDAGEVSGLWYAVQGTDFYSGAFVGAGRKDWIGYQNDDDNPMVLLGESTGGSGRAGVAESSATREGLDYWRPLFVHAPDIVSNTRLLNSGNGGYLNAILDADASGLQGAHSTGAVDFRVGDVTVNGKETGYRVWREKEGLAQIYIVQNSGEPAVILATGVEPESPLRPFTDNTDGDDIVVSGAFRFASYEGVHVAGRRVHDSDDAASGFFDAAEGQFTMEVDFQRGTFEFAAMSGSIGGAYFFQVEGDNCPVDPSNTRCVISKAQKESFLNNGRFRSTSLRICATAGCRLYPDPDPERSDSGNQAANLGEPAEYYEGVLQGSFYDEDANGVSGLWYSTNKVGTTTPGHLYAGAFVGRDAADTSQAYVARAFGVGNNMGIGRAALDDTDAEKRNDAGSQNRWTFITSGIDAVVRDIAKQPPAPSPGSGDSSSTVADTSARTVVNRIRTGLAPAQLGQTLNGTDAFLYPYPSGAGALAELSFRREPGTEIRRRTGSIAIGDVRYDVAAYEANYDVRQQNGTTRPERAGLYYLRSAAGREWFIGAGEPATSIPTGKHTYTGTQFYRHMEDSGRVSLLAGDVTITADFTKNTFVYDGSNEVPQNPIPGGVQAYKVEIDGVGIIKPQSGRMLAQNLNLKYDDFTHNTEVNVELYGQFHGQFAKAATGVFMSESIAHQGGFVVSGPDAHVVREYNGRLGIGALIRDEEADQDDDLTPPNPGKKQTEWIFIAPDIDQAVSQASTYDTATRESIEWFQRIVKTNPANPWDDGTVVATAGQTFVGPNPVVVTPRAGGEGLSSDDATVQRVEAYEVSYQVGDNEHKAGLYIMSRTLGQRVFHERDWIVAAGEPVSSLPSGEHVYSGVQYYLQYSDRVFSRQRLGIYRGNVTLNVDFTRNTFKYDGYLNPPGAEDLPATPQMTGSGRIRRATGGMQSSNMKLQPNTRGAAALNAALYGQFHGPNAEAATGVWMTDNDDYAGGFVAEKQAPVPETPGG